MSELEAKAVDLLDKLEALATEYTPEIIDTSVSIVQISAWGDIFYCIMSMVMGVGILFGAKYWYKFFMQKYKDSKSYTSDYDMLAQAGGFILVLIGSVCTIVGFTSLMDIWLWVGVFNPELALAYKLLGM